MGIDADEAGELNEGFLGPLRRGQLIHALLQHGEILDPLLRALKRLLRIDRFQRLSPRRVSILPQLCAFQMEAGDGQLMLDIFPELFGPQLGGLESATDLLNDMLGVGFPLDDVSGDLAFEFEVSHAILRVLHSGLPDLGFHLSQPVDSLLQILDPQLASLRIDQLRQGLDALLQVAHPIQLALHNRGLLGLLRRPVRRELTVDLAILRPLLSNADVLLARRQPVDRPRALGHQGVFEEPRPWHVGVSSLLELLDSLLLRRDFLIQSDDVLLRLGHGRIRRPDELRGLVTRLRGAPQIGVHLVLIRLGVLQVLLRAGRFSRHKLPELITGDLELLGLPHQEDSLLPFDAHRLHIAIQLVARRGELVQGPLIPRQELGFLRAL